MIKKSLFILSSVIMFFGCGGGGDDVEVYEGSDLEITAETDVALDLVMYDIPSPVDVARDIANSGIPYNKSLLNSTSKSGSYSTTYKKATNLGVYVADLSYAAAYEQTQDATSYLSTSTQLAENLGIGGAFNQELIKEFEKNLSNKDTMASLINQAYKNADKFLRSNDRVSVAAMVMAGGWLEGMYISLKAIEDKPKDAQNRLVYERIGGQGQPLKNLLKLLNQFKDNQELTTLSGPLAELDSVVYRNIPGPGAANINNVPKIAEKIYMLRAEMVK